MPMMKAGDGDEKRRTGRRLGFWRQLGFTRQQGHEILKLAEIPDDIFEHLLATMKRPSRRGLIARWEVMRGAPARQEATVPLDDDLWQAIERARLRENDRPCRGEMIRRILRRVLIED